MVPLEFLLRGILLWKVLLTSAQWPTKDQMIKAIKAAQSQVIVIDGMDGEMRLFCLTEPFAMDMGGGEHCRRMVKRCCIKVILKEA